MKKSLQYVLIMSALGLQSGVLLAQPDAKLGGGLNPSISQAMAITLDDLKNMINDAQNFPDLVGNPDLPSLTQLAPNGILSWDNLKGFTSPQKFAVINLLVNTPFGQKFVHLAIPRKEKENLLLEIAKSGRLDSVKSLYQFQAFPFMAAETGVDLYRDRRFSDYIPIQLEGTGFIV